MPLHAPLCTGTKETGAILDFWGVVRTTENGVEIAGLEYEAHPAMAEHQLEMLAGEAIARFSLQSILIHHRTAFVPAGEASLLLRVGSRHRAGAFHAGEWVVEELKKRVPIWKHPRPKATEGAALRENHPTGQSPPATAA